MEPTHCSNQQLMEQTIRSKEITKEQLSKLNSYQNGTNKSKGQLVASICKILNTKSQPTLNLSKSVASANSILTNYKIKMSSSSSETVNAVTRSESRKRPLIPDPSETVVPGTSVTPSAAQQNPQAEPELADLLDETRTEEESKLADKINSLMGEHTIAIMTMKDPLLRRVRDALIRKAPEDLQHIDPYYYNCRDQLHVVNGVVCYDEKVVIPTPLRKPLIELFHAIHPGQIGMLDVSENAFWPRMKRDLIFKAQTCKACTQIGKNLKAMSPKNKSAPLALLREPNEEIQLDFCGPVTNEKGKDQYILTCIDRFSKFQTHQM